MTDRDTPTRRRHTTNARHPCTVHDMAIDSYVAANVRAELARRQKTQGDLAKLLNTTPQAISRRLTGLTSFRVDELIAIADYFGMPVCDLIGDTDVKAAG